MKKKIAVVLMVVLSLSLMAILTGCSGDKGKNGEVHVYCFGDYIDPSLVGQFQNETGIKVVMDTFDTNEEMYPVIKNQSVNYDVVCASDYMIEKMIKENLLSEVNYGNIKNTENIPEKYMKISENFDPDNKYSVPYSWGTMGIIYNTKEISKGSITSWKDLWNKKYSGQIVMPDSMRDTMSIGLKAKGYSLNSTSQKEIKEATDYLIQQKPLVYKYANDSARDLILGGSANIAVVWNGEMLYCLETNPDLDFVIPSEGTEEFLDSWAIPKTAKNKENAQAWIDFMCKQEVAKTNYEYLTYSIPNNAVIDMVKDDADKMAILFPKDSVLKKCESLKSLEPNIDDVYSENWTRFKSK